MGQPDKLESDDHRMKRIGKDSEKQEGAKIFPLGETAKILEGDQERRDNSTRNPRFAIPQKTLTFGLRIASALNVPDNIKSHPLAGLFVCLETPIPS